MLLRRLSSCLSPLMAQSWNDDVLAISTHGALPLVSVPNTLLSQVVPLLCQGTKTNAHGPAHQPATPKCLTATRIKSNIRISSRLQCPV